MEETVDDILAKKDPWHCLNGHLIIISNNGRGCLREDCPYRIVGDTPVKPTVEENE